MSRLLLMARGEISGPRWLSISSIAVLVVALAVANLIPLVFDGGGLGHDESAYALKAKHWIEGTPETGWNLHRGVALSGYGYLVFELGGAEGELRLLGLIAIVGLAAATWMLGSLVGKGLVGPLSAMAIVASPILLRRSTEYLSDVPSAALLVACMVVIWKEFANRDAPTYRLLWLLPFAWAAFYFRYQSSLSFMLMAGTVAVLFMDKLRRGWKPIALTALFGLVGLVPHFAFSSSETSSPFGILLFTAEVAGREFIGEGLIDYFLLMGWPLVALLGPMAVIFFVWWIVKGWPIADERQRALFLLLPAAGQVLILGILSHGEARFIFFPLALTLIGGITGVFFVSREWREVTRRATSIGLVLTLIVSLALASVFVRRDVTDRATETLTVVMAAEMIRELSGDTSCGVMTSYQPQITFYSECITAPFRLHLSPEDALSRFGGDEQYLLVVEGGKRQPGGVDLEILIGATDGDPVLIEGARDSAEIFFFGP